MTDGRKGPCQISDKGEMAEDGRKKAQEVYQAVQKESSGFLPQVIFKR